MEKDIASLFDNLEKSPKKEEKESPEEKPEPEKKEEPEKESPKEPEPETPPEKKSETPPEEKSEKEKAPEPKEDKKEKKEKEKTSFFEVPQKSDSEFDLSPAKPESKHIIMIYGLKGAGKTSLAFSFPETHACLSFDNKSISISEQMDKSEQILVFNGARYYDKSSPDMWLESAYKSWRYLNKLLDTIEGGKDATGDYNEKNDHRPDWVVVDGGEIFHQMAEMVMRYNNSLMPFEGIKNLNVWKERGMYIDQLLRKTTAKSKKGVIWTAYLDHHDVIEEGQFVTKEDVPKYISHVMYETDCVIRVERTTAKQGQRFYATVQTSKWSKLPETPKTDITENGIETLVKPGETI